MDRAEVVSFIRQRGLAVVATGGPDGTPQAALVGVAGTDQAEIILLPPPPRVSTASSKPDVPGRDRMGPRGDRPERGISRHLDRR